MGNSAKTLRAAAVAVGLSVFLASCAGGPFGGKDKVASSSRPASAASAPSGPLRGDPVVWNLRAGLNVAALSCRKKDIERDYRRVLDRHRTLLRASYSEAQRRGGRGFDREQTKLYNRFAQYKSSAKFCATAALVAKDASRMQSHELAPNARRLFSQLDRARS